MVVSKGANGKIYLLKLYVKGCEKSMAGFKKVTKEDAENFLKLYKKYLLMKVENMETDLKNLPTNVIERCFDGAEFYDKDFDISKLDEAQFGFGGLHGYKKLVDVVKSLEYCSELNKQGRLDEVMERVGFKVNHKKVGVL